MFCPQKKHNIPVLTCLNLPKKEELLRLLRCSFAEQLRKKKKLVVQNEDAIKALIRLLDNPNKVPDMNWLLLVIAAIGGPEHPLFAKGYKPPESNQGPQPLFK